MRSVANHIPQWHSKQVSGVYYAVAHEVIVLKQAIIDKYRFLIKTIGYVGWSLFWLLIWDIVVTADFMLFLDRKISLPSLPLTLLASALVVLTSFRNSSAYNRWWEARTLWGAMVNNSRSFARQVLTLVEDDDELNPVKAVLLRRHVAFVKCLSAHLKGESCGDEVQSLITREEYARRHETNNFPNDILNTSAALLAKEYKAGRLDSIRLARLESTMVELSNCGAGWSVSPIRRCLTLTWRSRVCSSACSA